MERVMRSCWFLVVKTTSTDAWMRAWAQQRFTITNKQLGTFQ
jgi:hypothetical protein